MQYVILRYRTACDFRRGPHTYTCTAAAMSTPKCVVCLAELPRSTSRRRLTSDSNKHIIPVLREIGHRVFSAVNELLPETNDTCLCRPCFRKLIRLRQDAYNLEMNLADRLKQSGESHGLLPNDRLVSADWNTMLLIWARLMYP